MLHHRVGQESFRKELFEGSGYVGGILNVQRVSSCSPYRVAGSNLWEQMRGGVGEEEQLAGVVQYCDVSDSVPR